MKGMTNAELVKALRWCGDDNNEWCVHEEYKCPLWSEDRMVDECKAEMMRDAADALEAADEKIADYTAAIEALDDSNDAYIKENERLKKQIAEQQKQIAQLYLLLNNRINEIAELESQAAFFDAEKLNYQENIEYRDERIKELEAQLKGEQ